MKRLRLDIHGASVELLSADAAALSALERDFEHFIVAADGTPSVRLTLEAAAPPPAVPRRAWLRTRDYAAWDDGGLRRILYRDGAYAEFDHASGEGRLWCADAARLHELAYLAVLSRAGEAPDRRGLHRVHALGFRAGEGGGLLLLPSGGGKSVLALELLRSSDFGLLSDESPLAALDGTLLPFPLRWAFKDPRDARDVPQDKIRPFQRARYGVKWTVDVSFFRHRIADPAPARWLLIGTRSGRGPLLRPASLPAAWASLIRHMVVGVGLAQMAEYTLRADAGLAGIAVSRLSAARRLVGQSRRFHFELGDDPRANARTLVGLVSGSEGPGVERGVAPGLSAPEAGGGRAPGAAGEAAPQRAVFP